MNEKLIKEKAKNISKNYFEDLLFEEQQELFKDCFYCCDCEFNMFNSDNQNVCAGKYYDKKLSEEDNKKPLCDCSDIDFNTYSYFYDLVLKHCKK